MNNYFLTCPRGLEEITANQIAKHIQNIPEIDFGGIQFKGNKIDMYKANLYSRTGMHVLKELYSININHQKDLYKTIENLLNQRADLYQSTAHLTINVDPLSIQQISDKIIAYYDLKKT